VCAEHTEYLVVDVWCAAVGTVSACRSRLVACVEMALPSAVVAQAAFEPIVAEICLDHRDAFFLHSVYHLVIAVKNYESVFVFSNLESPSSCGTIHFELGGPKQDVLEVRPGD
jgi:hypothetical protein